jgi:surface antigen
MPSALNNQTLGSCPDPELAEKNFGCDSVGNVLTVQSKEEMTRSTQSNLDYMIGHGYIDEEGNTVAGSDYEKFTEYCTGKDQMVPGTSILSLEDDDYDWPNSRCQSDEEEISQFRTYTSRVGSSDDEDTQYTDGEGGDGTTAPADTGADITGDDFKTECPQYGGKCDGECVDFVIFRLVKHKVLPRPMALGNGKDIVGSLGRMGYKVDTTPAVHAVMSTPVTSTPQYGHTAMVSKVNADGSFVVEEYNFASHHAYGTRTIPASDIAAKKMTFAHTEVDYK